ncbi:MAG TPA: peptidylprolyl isomerase [Candidatus Paceibacterota bacterium]
MKQIIIFIILIGVAGAGYWLLTKNNNKPVATPEISKAIINQVETKTEEKIMSAILHTNKGDITIEFNSATPKTVENFSTLVKKGFYDGTKFHRVIKDFMNQGGDPLSKDDAQKALWGTGGPGYKFADEITATNRNDIGTIAMANSGPNTNGSQFFINTAANNFLDTKHTVFGKVTAGLDVVTAINSVSTDSTDKPLDPIIIKSITLK